MLSEKLVNINQRAEEGKTIKNIHNNIQQQLHNFHEKVLQKSAAQDIQFKILKEQIDRLADDLEEERRIREEFEVEISENVYPVPGSSKYMTLEQISSMIIDKQNSAKREIEQSIKSTIEEKVFSLTLALAKEKKAREEDEEEYFNEVIEDLNILRDEVEQEKLTTEENSEKMIQKLSQEIAGFHEALHDEIEARESSFDNIHNIIQQMHESLTQDLEHERNDRLETEE